MPYTADQYTNFGISSVAGGAAGRGTPLQPSDTTLYLPVGDGAKLPQPSGGMTFRMQLGTTELVKVTGRATDTLTVVRGVEGTTAQTWLVGTSAILAVTAAGIADLWAAINQGRPFIVTDYGATGNGSTDDTAAIQAAITAASSAGGGRVYLPAGTYNISTTLTINHDNVALVGDGFSSVLFASFSWPNTNIPMVWVQQPGSDKRYGVRIESLSFNGNSRTGVSAALQADGIMYSGITGCEFHACSVLCLYMNGSASYFGAYNLVAGNLFHDCYGAWAIKTTNSEWSVYANNRFILFNNAGAGAIHTVNLNNNFVGNTFDACDTALWLDFAQYCTVVGNQFDLTARSIYLKGAQYNSIIGNSFGKLSTSATTYDSIYVEQGSTNNVVSGNTCKEGQGWAHFVFENGNVAGEPSLYTGNDTGNYPMTLVTGIARGNRGYNPLGASITPPGAPTVNNATSGGTIAAGTYQVVVTLVNSRGETFASSTTSTTTTTGASTITVTSPGASGNATGWYAYVSQVGGSTKTRQQTTGLPTAIGTNLTLTAPPTSTGPQGPGSNTTGVSTPSVPATTVAQTNGTGVDCMVYVTGGTVSQIQVDSLVTGLTSGPFRVPAGSTITLTYSAAPTWKWYGE